MKINYKNISIFIFIYFCFIIKEIKTGREQTTNGLHIVKNQIFNEEGELIMLRGVNRPGTEYTCVKQQAVFDGPISELDIDVIKKWKLNAIRVPLNEDCWLGSHGNEASWFGQGYRDHIKSFVDQLSNQNMAIIIDLHWSSKNGSLALDQIPMPNSEGSILFWKSVATTFKDNSRVIFDLYNEPYPHNNEYDSPDAWQCWKDGTKCNSDLGYEASGMQQLLNAVRSVGAKNIVLMSGIQYASSFVRYLDYMPRDTISPPQLGASLHAYDFNQCKAKGCWDQTLKPVANVMPIIATETGQKDCLHDFLKDFLQYCDSAGIHYLAWSWLVGDCNIPSLIQSYDGTPSNFGLGYLNHMQRLAKGKDIKYSESFDIYNDKMTHWADNWSSGSPILNSTEVIPCEGNFSIKFIPKKGRSLHFMCVDCIHTNVHKQVEFWVHGGNTGGQQLKFELLDLNPDKTNKVLRSYNVQDELKKPIPANQWTQVIIPLVPEPVENYDGFWIKADSDQPTVYVDKITVRAINEPDDDDDDNSSVKLIFNIFTILLITLFSILII